MELTKRIQQDTHLAAVQPGKTTGTRRFIRDDSIQLKCRNIIISAKQPSQSSYPVQARPTNVNVAPNDRFKASEVYSVVIRFTERLTGNRGSSRVPRTESVASA